MTYTDKYGQPQGNELVYGKDIIRRLDTFEFRLIDRFKNSRAAHQAYQDWMAEYGGKIWADAKDRILSDNNKCSVCKDTKSNDGWSYARMIIAFDENGQPIFEDSWGQ